MCAANNWLGHHSGFLSVVIIHLKTASDLSVAPEAYFRSLRLGLQKEENHTECFVKIANFIFSEY